jgi:hypothetical protein
LAAQHAKTLDAGRLLAGFEEKLIAKTDAKIRTPGKRPLTHGIPEPRSTKVFCTVREGPYAWNDDRIKRGKV